MALIGVGVVEDIKITNVVINKTDAGQSLDVTFSENVVAVKQPTDELDMFNSANDSREAKANNIRFYPVNLTTYDGAVKTGDELVNEVFGLEDKTSGKREISGLKAQLTHILEAYLPTSEIKWNLFEGLELKSAAELVQKITKQSTLDKLMNNMFTQFKKMLEPVMAKEEVAVKFLRKSQASNFPRLNARKIDWNPFIANMKDSKLKSKLKFSAYEIEKGLDSNAQSLDGADTLPVELDAQTAALNAVFN